MNRTLSKSIMHIVLIIGALIMILPLLWMLITSFKTDTEATAMNPFVLFPHVWLIQNYTTALLENDFVHLYINTFAMMAFRILCAVVFSSMAAYAFARLEFPLKNFFFGLVLFQMMVPVQVFIIPQYLMITKIHMQNTIFALVFPGIVSAFGTFLLRQFFLGMPKELEEASILDGCNTGQTYLYVMMPLAKSGLVALSIFTALFAFKDLMWPLIVNPDAAASTLSSALARIQGAYSVHFPQLMASAVLAIWPMLLIYIIFQRQFIEGIATTGGKL